MPSVHFHMHPIGTRVAFTNETYVGAVIGHETAYDCDLRRDVLCATVKWDYAPLRREHAAYPEGNLRAIGEDDPNFVAPTMAEERPI